MAWIASRARKAEMMEKERMISEKMAIWIDQKLEVRTRLRSQERRGILKMGQLHLEYDAHDSDLQREKKEEIKVREERGLGWRQVPFVAHGVGNRVAI